MNDEKLSVMYTIEDGVFFMFMVKDTMLNVMNVFSMVGVFSEHDKTGF